MTFIQYHRLGLTIFYKFVITLVVFFFVAKNVTNKTTINIPANTKNGAVKLVLLVRNCASCIEIGAIKLPILQPIKINEVAKLIVFFVVTLSKLLKINGKHHDPVILDKNKPVSRNAILPFDVAINKFEIIKNIIPKYRVPFPIHLFIGQNINPASIPKIVIRAK